MANDLIVNIDADSSGVDEGIAGIKQNLAIVSQSLMEFGSKIADAFSGIMSSTLDAQKTLSKFQNQTGTTAKMTAEYGKAMKDIYKKGIGESLNDISEGMAIVKQQSTILKISNVADAKEMTKNAMLLKDTFGTDVSESVKTVGNLMKNFGITGEEAFDLIAKGFQDGLDQSGDFIDTLYEYSPQFAKMGMSASDMYSILKKGSEAGIFTIDKMGDAIKEFGIRAIDGSENTKKAFTSINLDADLMARSLALGGTEGQKAFFDIIQAIGNLEDPLKQNEMGVYLFGTMWEDLGGKAILSLGEAEGSLVKFKGTMEQIKKVDMKDITKEFESFKRTIEVDVLQPIAMALLPALKKIGEIAKQYLPMFSDAIKDTSPTIITVVAVVGGLVTALIPLIGIIGTLIPAFEAVGAVVSSIGGVIGGVAIGPVLLIIGAIVGLIAIFVMFKDKIIEVFNNVKAVVLPILTNVFNYIKNAFANTFQPIINEHLPKLQSAFTNILGSIQNYVSTVIPIIISIFEFLLPVFKIVGVTLKTLFDNFVMILGFAVDMLATIIEAIINILSGAIDMITGIFNVFVGVFTGDWSRAWEGIKQIFAGFWEITKSIAILGFNTIKNFISITLNQIWNIFSNALNSIFGVSSNVLESVKGVFIGAFESVKSIVWNAISQLPNYIYNIASSMYNAGATIINQLIQGIKNSIQTLKNTCSSVANTISNFFPHSPAKEGSLRNFPDVGYTLMDQLINGIEKQKRNVIDVIGNVTAGISNSVGNVNYNVGKSEAITIPIYLDGNQITKVVAPKMTKIIRQQGGY